MNDYDRHGHKCPLKPKDNVACPLLCVTSHDLCPSALAPTCPPGQVFCGDGTCQTSCDGISNACTCGYSSSAYENYVPCAAGQTVNITHFDPANAQTQTQQVCAAAAQLNATDIGVWGVDVNTTSIWLQCPAAPEPTFTFREPMWIAVWTLGAFEAALLTFWHFYKTLREMPFRRAVAATAAARQQAAVSAAINEKAVAAEDEKDSDKKTAKQEEEDSETSSLQDSERLVFRGFHPDFFGTICLGSVVITTLLFIIFLGCIVSDYCKCVCVTQHRFFLVAHDLILNLFGCTDGNLGGQAFAIFLTSDLSSKIFCAVWHIAAAWFATILFARKRIRNYFRIESFAHEAPYVQVERRQEEIIFLDDGSKWLAKLREIEQRIRKRLK